MLTSLAQPRERDAAPEHLCVRRALGEGTQLCLRLIGQRHVDDPAALHTVQVRVGGCAGVKPLLPAEHADAHRVALFGEEAQVPVHRAEAQVGVVRLELLVELLRGGWAVVAARASRMTCRFLLFLRVGIEAPPCKSVTRIITDMKIPQETAFVKPFLRMILKIVHSAVFSAPRFGVCAQFVCDAA